jgi:hypothetical protein
VVAQGGYRLFLASAIYDCVNTYTIVHGPEEVGQLISELSREFSTNEIALFSIVLSAEFGQKNLHSTENKSEKNNNIKISLQNLKCCSTTTKDLGPVVQKTISLTLG